MDNYLEIPVGFTGRIIKVGEKIFEVAAEELYTFSRSLISLSLLEVGNFIYWTGKEFILEASVNTQK